MVPPHVRMVLPHMYDMIFFRPASKESTACPNQVYIPVYLLSFRWQHHSQYRYTRRNLAFKHYHELTIIQFSTILYKSVLL